MIKQQLQALMTQEMNRKNFLQYSGSLLLAMIGVSGFIRILLGQSKSLNGPVNPVNNKQNGYGNSKYGQ